MEGKKVEWGKKKASFYFYEIGSILQKRQMIFKVSINLVISVSLYIKARIIVSDKSHSKCNTDQ